MTMTTSMTTLVAIEVSIIIIFVVFSSIPTITSNHHAVSLLFGPSVATVVVSLVSHYLLLLVMLI